MAIKAVFFDIDGTLLTDTKRVQSSTVKAIQQLKAQGIIVGLATGRGPAFVTPYMETYGFDVAVTYNGQYVFTRDAIIYANPLPKSTIIKLMAYAKKQRLEISFGTSSGLLGSGLIHLGTSSKAQLLGNMIPKSWAKGVERTFKHVFRRLRPQNYDKLTALTRETIYQIVVVATADKVAGLEAAFPHVSITRSSPYSADLISSGQSKLQGIRRLATHFDLTLEQVMAFGDADNDAEMLTHVGIGVAMGNGRAAIKQVADYVTADNNHDGIAKALWHYGLISLEVSQPFQSADDQFNKVRDFHHLADGSQHFLPRAYDLAQASHRAQLKAEKLVEFLDASSQNDTEALRQAVDDLHAAIDRAFINGQQQSSHTSPLVAQNAALVDLLYLTYGSFVRMGVDSQPIFDIVHRANMSKLFPDEALNREPITDTGLTPDHFQERFAPEPALKRELDRQMQKALKHQAH